MSSSICLKYVSPPHHPGASAAPMKIGLLVIVAVAVYWYFNK